MCVKASDVVAVVYEQTRARVRVERGGPGSIHVFVSPHDNEREVERVVRDWLPICVDAFVFVDD